MRTQKQMRRGGGGGGGFLSSSSFTSATAGSKRRPNLTRPVPAATTATTATSIAIGADNNSNDYEYDYEYEYENDIDGGASDALLPTTVVGGGGGGGRKHFSAPCCRCSWLGLITILNFLGIVVLAIVVVTMRQHALPIQAPAPVLAQKTMPLPLPPPSLLQLEIRESASFVLDAAQASTLDGFAIADSLFPTAAAAMRIAWFNICCTDRNRLVCGATHKKRNLHLFAYLSLEDNRATVFTNNPKLQGAVCKIIVAAEWNNNNNNRLNLSEKADAL